MARRIFEFHCSECHQIFDRLVDSEVREIECKHCGCEGAKRIISAVAGVS